MSIRITACYLYVLIFGWIARRSWFISACAAISLMAVIQHPDMPKNVMDIQGFNPWNLLFASVLVCWWLTRQRLGWHWEMPSYVNLLLFLYLMVVLFSVGRYIFNPSGWVGDTFGNVTSEYLINCIKWVLPGMLVFDGARNRRYVFIAIGAILAIYLLLSVQVIRWVPFGAGSGKASRYISNEIGYNRVTLSMMLGGASYAVLCTALLFSKWKYKLLIALAALAVVYAQAVTGGRSGYVSWLVVGFILCVVRWRKFLPLIPVALILVLAFVPGVRERILQGFGDQDAQIVVRNDEYEMTSGRNIAWPAVIDQIWKGPIVGFGREAMSVTGVQRYLAEEFGESFPHPHQAYLEVLLDMGIIGFLIIVPFFVMVVFHALRLLRDREDPLVCVVGTVCCALVLALLVAGFGGQTFYPREGAVGMWAAIGLMFRVYIERRRQPHGLLFVEEEESGDVIETEVVEPDYSR
jgi:O-antigen ligase